MAELEGVCQGIAQTSLGFKILDIFYLNDPRAEFVRIEQPCVGAPPGPATAHAATNWRKWHFQISFGSVTETPDGGAAFKIAATVPALFLLNKLAAVNNRLFWRTE
jgi:hypothetical protein